MLTLIPTRTITFGKRPISFKGSLIWNKLPNVYKNANTLTAFKNEIKKMEWYQM